MGLCKRHRSIEKDSQVFYALHGGQWQKFWTLFDMEHLYGTFFSCSNYKNSVLR